MRVMMYGHSGSLNRGCEAIVRSSSIMLKEKMDIKKIILASENPDTDKKISELDLIFNSLPIEFKPNIIERLICLLELKLARTEHYALKKIHESIINKIDEVDIVLSIGGDNYCYGEQPAFYEINKIAKEKGKKLVLWGCSIGEEDISERKLKDLKRFDLILARETITFELLKKSGIKNVKLVADPAFTLKKEDLELPTKWKENDTIGLNFSPLVENINKKSGQAVEELIKYILKTTKSTIALTPHVTIDGNNDYEILKTYYEKFKNTDRVILLPKDLNAIQYKGYISRMRAFIGARTHATIAAYSSCVPTMVLGYSVKSRGIAKDIFGNEKLVLGINEISDIRKLKINFDEMIKNEKDIIKILKRKIPSIKDMSYKSIHYLNEVCNN